MLDAVTASEDVVDSAKLTLIKFQAANTASRLVEQASKQAVDGGHWTQLDVYVPLTQNQDS
jgi:hypothetical protein